MRAELISSSHAMRICAVLLFAVASFGYPAQEPVVTQNDLLLAKALQNGEFCCPCVLEKAEADRQGSRGSCCPCTLEQRPKKIPLAPLQRGSVLFSNDDKDPTVKSCELITGDLLSSPPNCISFRKRQVDCFYVNYETQTAFHKILKNGEPQASIDSKGKVRDEVIPVAKSSNKFTLVALNQSNHLLTRMVREGDWTDWETIENAMAVEVPSVFMRGSGGVTCFYRTFDNSLWYVDRSRYGKWEQPKKLELKGMVSPPTCAERGDGDAEDCFALASDNSVAHEMWVFGREWELQAGAGGRGKQRISVTSWSYDRADIFVLGSGNQLMHRAFVEEDWEDWEDLGGSFVSAPECIAIEEEAIHCFMVGVDRALMRKSFDGESWSDWVSSSYAMIEKPSCVVTEGSTIACYSRGYTGHMVEIVYDL